MTTFVPTFMRQKITDNTGYFTPEMHNFMDLLVQQIQTLSLFMDSVQSGKYCTCAAAKREEK